MRVQPSYQLSTLANLGVSRLAALARQVGFSDELPEMQRLFCELLSPWGELELGESPAWPSDVSDDHTPFEFSVAVGGQAPELRVLVESRGNPPSLQSNQKWGLAVNELLRQRYGVSLERFDQIRDLFLPEKPEGVFAIWHAVSFWPGRAPEFKLYLNLAAQGQARAPHLAKEALERLGFGDSWSRIAEHSLQRGPDLDKLMYFSLDMTAKPEARVKLYFRHHAAHTRVLERSCAAAVGHAPEHLGEFCNVLSEQEGPYMGKAPVVCLTFLPHQKTAPSSSTLYFPIAAYAPNDRVACDRIASYLARHGLPVQSYAGPLGAFATRRLEDGVGMQSYASLRFSDGRPRVTVYFSPEAYRVEPPRPHLASTPVRW